MFPKLSNNIDKIAEPFMTFRSDKVGLGLSIADKIISLHNGTLENRIDVGREMITRVILPLNQQEN